MRQRDLEIERRSNRNVKILNGYEHNYFSVKEDSRTRGNTVTLTKTQCRLDMRKLSFSHRRINERNRLSAECVGASSVNNI